MWLPVDTLITNDGSTSFDDLSTDFNGKYGSIAWTSTRYNSISGKFVKDITAHVWDPVNDKWSASPLTDNDSSYYFAQPHVSVNDSGLVSVTYQILQLFNDTAAPDLGQLNLWVNDSKNNPTHWSPNNGNTLLGDSMVYDWDVCTSYGKGNNFYVITQEADPATGNAPINPPNGVRFGDTKLNLVFRSLDVSNTGGVTDIAEPKGYSTLSNGNMFDFILYPNPVVSQTTIEFNVSIESKVSIEIFDLFGKKITTIHNGKLNPGTYQAIFEPNGLANGIYLCKVTINGQSVIKKMIIAK